MKIRSDRLGTWHEKQRECYTSTCLFTFSNSCEVFPSYFRHRARRSLFTEQDSVNQRRRCTAFVKTIGFFLLPPWIWAPERATKGAKNWRWRGVISLRLRLRLRRRHRKWSRRCPSWQSRFSELWRCPGECGRWKMRYPCTRAFVGLRSTGGGRCISSPSTTAMEDLM